MIDERDLPADWWVDDQANLDALTVQLQREVPEGHSLKGRALFAVARADGKDDVLYTDDKGRFYSVHLTWSATNEPGYPSFQEFSTLGQFRLWWEKLFPNE